MVDAVAMLQALISADLNCSELFMPSRLEPLPSDTLHEQVWYDAGHV